jgi:hypothetical protein
MLTESGPNAPYHLVVISDDGKVTRKATGQVPSIGGHLPRFSVAGRSVYFIDADTHLKALRPDGSIATIAELPGGSSDRVVFAVSPDETQIALSVLHYAAGCTSPTQICTTTSLRVGALDLHDLHEIYAGPVVEFPVGWHQGHLVISVAQSGFIQNPGEVNPYFATAFHLADPSNANRLFSTSPTCDEPSSLLGPINSFGVVCQRYSGNLQIVSELGWDGTSHELYRSDADSYRAVPPVVLRPDGHSAVGPIAIDHHLAFLDGGVTAASQAMGTPAGWFDENHLLYMAEPCCTELSQPIVLVVSQQSVDAAFPISTGVSGTADPYAPFFVPIPSSL